MKSLRKEEKELVDLKQLDDANFKLSKWAKIINNLITRHGADATLWVDAGHNNVEFKLQKKKNN